MRLYIHWPFCVSRCAYCDFNARVAGRRVIRSYRESLIREINVWSERLEDDRRFLRSVYLGGGTPSTQSGEETAGMLAEVARCFELEQDAEITVEINPATWKYADFARARDGGFNRFSIGVQSFDKGMLGLLGRAHDAEQAKETMHNARRVGDAVISVDVIYALPEEAKQTVYTTMYDLLSWRPHHISLYALTLEKRTPLARMVGAGEVNLPGDDDAADQYLELSDMLMREGYQRYEISNFCLPGYRCSHNQAYWRREEYLGVGAGAHSMLGQCRFANLASVLEYTHSIARKQFAVEWCDVIDDLEELRETVMLGLRTSDGVPTGLIGEEDALDEMERMGFIERRRGRVSLTTRGMMLSNPVIGELLPA